MEANLGLMLGIKSKVAEFTGNDHFPQYVCDFFLFAREIRMVRLFPLQCVVTRFPITSKTPIRSVVNRQNCQQKIKSSVQMSGTHQIQLTSFWHFDDILIDQHFWS